MKIVSWNANSIRARLESFAKLAVIHNPDIILLQETRVEYHQFPREAIEDFGYNLAIKGQKGRNDVAICSKYPIEEVYSDFCEEARYVEAFTVCWIFELSNAHQIMLRLCAKSKPDCRKFF